MVSNLASGGGWFQPGNVKIPISASIHRWYPWNTGISHAGTSGTSAGGQYHGLPGSVLMMYPRVGRIISLWKLQFAGILYPSRLPTRFQFRYFYEFLIFPFESFLVNSKDLFWGSLPQEHADHADSDPSRCGNQWIAVAGNLHVGRSPCRKVLFRWRLVKVCFFARSLSHHFRPGHILLCPLRELVGDLAAKHTSHYTPLSTARQQRLKHSVYGVCVFLLEAVQQPAWCQVGLLFPWNFPFDQIPSSPWAQMRGCGGVVAPRSDLRTSGFGLSFYPWMDLAG